MLKAPLLGVCRWMRSAIHQLYALATERHVDEKIDEITFVDTGPAEIVGCPDAAKRSPTQAHCLHWYRNYGIRLLPNPGAIFDTAQASVDDVLVDF